MQLKRNKEMEFETLKKSHKKQIIIGALAICVIGGSLTFATTRAKYKLTQDIPLARGTVNYTPYDFKIMAMYQSEDGNNYTEINEMPESGYTINEEKSYCEMDDGTQVKGKFKTIDKQHTITNITKHDKCYIWFDKVKAPAEETLANLNIANVKESVTTFSNIATTDEGVFKIEDGMYGENSYYWRGAVINNYITFAGKCWRIIRINGDGSIRLIYDGTICHANGTNTAESIAIANQVYNSKAYGSSYVGWTHTIGQQRTLVGTSSNAKTQVETWYNNNLKSFETKIADGKFCNDRNVPEGTEWVESTPGINMSARKRADNKQATLSCDAGDTYVLKVGLITSDEITFAGGLLGTNNTSYYLYNGQNYWTMSPNGNGGSAVLILYVYTTGGFSYKPMHETSNIRPVINLRSDVTISSGNGTLDNPYVVQ